MLTLSVGTLCAGSYFLALGGTSGAEIVVSPQSLTLSPKPDGSESTGAFQILNTGKHEVKLGQPSTTCVCTVAEIEPTTIPPGGTATVSIRANPIGAGRTRVVIKIPTNTTPMELALPVEVVGRSEPPYVALAIDAIRFGEVDEADASVPLFVETREFSNRPPWLHDPASTVPGIRIEGGFADEGDMSNGIVWRRYDYTARLITLPPPGEFLGELLFAGREAGEEPVFRLPIHGICSAAGEKGRANP
ncbi:MAG: DUF1573 domain-containing protein [Isosphaeraceae bacterium]